MALASPRLSVSSSRSLAHQLLGSIKRVSDPLFFADPDPGKNLHADPDPGGIRRRGVGVKGHNDFFFEFFSRFR